MPPGRSTRSVTVEPEPKPHSTTAKRKRSQDSEDDEDSYSKGRKSTSKPMQAPVALTQSEEQPLPRPEEPTGPKSRLTIHKMALVNFKSYAGRQEIGPFHKVRSDTISN